MIKKTGRIIYSTRMQCGKIVLRVYIYYTPLKGGAEYHTFTYPIVSLPNVIQVNANSTGS